MTKDLTKGNIPKLLIGFFIPIIFGRLFQQVYSVVDAAVVGRTLGVTALGGVPKYGFIAACIAPPAAWLLVDPFLIIAFIVCFKKRRAEYAAKGLLKD